jgi:hypothetical protein
MDKTPETISYYAHESIVARMERTTKRLFILCIIIFAAFVGTNLGWVIYESSYTDVVLTETSQDGEGTNIMGAGDIYYGTEDTDSQN